MRGFLKMTPAWSQLVIVICMALVSLFLVGALGSVILAKMAGISLLEVGNIAKMDPNNPRTIFLIRGFQVVQFFALFVIPVLVCSWMFSTNTKKYLGLQASSRNSYYLWASVIMIVSIPLIGFVGELNQRVEFPADIAGWMKKEEESAKRTINALLSRHTIKDLLLNLIFIAGLAAVGEELLFRGMIQRLLIKIFKSPWAGIIVAAILFSAMHVQFYGFIPRFMLGVFLGAAYWYSGSLWVPMLAHFVYDGLMIVLTYYKPEMIADEKGVALSSMAVAASVSAALVGWILFRMKKESAATYESVYADDAIPLKNHPF
ncbi:MAG: CPBP family intramembrane metalloprotease [Bacteroidetes bacterium]|nr:CPBP family intramembrane metalloprotease [Bacteroidota bacterium]